MLRGSSECLLTYYPQKTHLWLGYKTPPAVHKKGWFKRRGFPCLFRPCKEITHIWNEQFQQSHNVAWCHVLMFLHFNWWSITMGKKSPCLMLLHALQHQMHQVGKVSNLANPAPHSSRTTQRGLELQGIDTDKACNCWCASWCWCRKNHSPFHKTKQTAYRFWVRRESLQTEFVAKVLKICWCLSFDARKFRRVGE